MNQETVNKANNLLAAEKWCSDVITHMKSWNSETNQWWYEKTMEEAIDHGLTGSELKPSHQNLSNPSLITKSKRIYRMVLLAFFLGRLRQIRWMDEGLDVISPQEVER